MLNSTFIINLKKQFEEISRSKTLSIYSLPSFGRIILHIEAQSETRVIYKRSVIILMSSAENKRSKHLAL